MHCCEAAQPGAATPGHFNVVGLFAFLADHHDELSLLPFGERAEALAANRAEMHEQSGDRGETGAA